MQVDLVNWVTIVVQHTCKLIASVGQQEAQTKVNYVVCVRLLCSVLDGH
jgi:hypothetical protein